MCVAAKFENHVTKKLFIIMKKLLLLAALFFTVNNTFAQTPEDPAQLRNEGAEALSAKNYAVAFDKFSKYLELTNNQDSVIAFNCGVCADNIKKYADAAKYFDIAIQKNYNVTNAYVGKAGAYRDMNNNAKYVETLQEGLKAVPGNATLEKLYAIYYLKAGQAFQKKGNVAKAEENYKEITTLQSKKWKTDALYSLGVLFYNNGANLLKANATANKDKAAADFKKANDYLEEAVALSPERAEIKKILDSVKTQL